MENQPQNIIAIGRKRFPIEEIALVEPFEPPAEQPSRFTSDKDLSSASSRLLMRARTANFPT
jgi:hypothetical protein